MSEQRSSIHGQWSSRFVFILAAVGSAVGLGNIWKFPYITGENGGGAFVIIYLCCIAAIGAPIMTAEILLGRRGRQSPINTMRALVKDEGAHPAWSLLGWGGVITGFLILSYYSVIAGWALSYVFQTAAGSFTGANAQQVVDLFHGFLASPATLLVWHSLFMVMTMFVVARGVRGGLERAVTLLMPALFLLLLILVAYSMSLGAFGKGLDFLFSPDFGKVFFHCELDAVGTEVCSFSGEPILVALGHAFFTLSLGMGAIMVYGSYMPGNASIARATLAIVIADTAVALLAGMAIFPIVFANGLQPAAGPGLIFQTLPIAFGAMPFGQLFGTLFFVLLVFAAWSSAISIIEPAVAWLVENHGMKRVSASVFVGALAWFLGLGTLLSFNVMSGEEFQLFGKTIFDLVDYLTANILLPLGGFFIALFAGWIMSRASTRDELQMGESFAYRGWRFLVRYVSPTLVVIVFLHAIGVI
ncbi:sodium:neurotransmitter symporter [Thiorhodococcus drewsii AZ1]|uniref:Transporter n=1 Tax=Thiorhodococcus drewsii AZ1 TaxID=765913 RepID=G2E226_9GAMM|nr:sodium-dependent transporter [Thiorhodococcus drewsii]EGV30975.1 sodium:neurotransmitter symporter [Thiorhodococcus drewsii AZ1]